MSDRPQGEGWWLASDGKWYPPESRPAPPAPPAAPWAAVPRTRLSPGLHTAVRVFLYLTAAAMGFAVVATAYAIPKMSAWWQAPLLSNADELAAWERASDVMSGANGLAGLCGLVLFVLLLVWGSQAYRSLERFDATGRSWSSGWAVGGWFIPLGNLVIPRLVMSEIERIPHPDNGSPPVGDRWLGRPLLGTGLGWWWALVGSMVVSVIGAVVMLTATEMSGQGSDMISVITDGTRYRNGMVVSLLASVGTGIALLLGAAYFRSLGERLLR